MPSLQVFLLLLLLIYYIIMSEILIQAHLLNKHVLVLNDSIQMRISMYILIILSSCINFMAHWCTGSTTTDTVISVILVIPWYILIPLLYCAIHFAMCCREKLQCYVVVKDNYFGFRFSKVRVIDVNSFYIHNIHY